MRRLAAAVLGAIVLGASAGTAVAAEEIAADPAAERDSFDFVNAARADHGLGVLEWRDRLAEIARDHSEDMARDGALSHNDELPNQVDGWSRLAENVGDGPSAASIHEAFMASEGHRDHILGSYTLAGVGAVRSEGTLWLTQVFMTPEQTVRTVIRRAPRSVAAPRSQRRITRTVSPAPRVRTPAKRPPAPQPQTLAMLERLVAVFGSEA